MRHHEGPFLFFPLKQAGLDFNGIRGVGMCWLKETSRSLLKATKATWPGRWSRWGGRDGHGCVMGDREAESAGVILATDRRKERPLLSHCISRTDWADGADRRKTGELERELVRE
jgi:hypothetical protein